MLSCSAITATPEERFEDWSWNFGSYPCEAALRLRHDAGKLRSTAMLLRPDGTIGGFETIEGFGVPEVVTPAVPTAAHTLRITTHSGTTELRL